MRITDEGWQSTSSLLGLKSQILVTASACRSSSERLPTPESSVKANGSPRRGSGPHSTAAAGTAIRSLPFKTRDVEQEARRKLAFLVYDSEYKTKRGPGSLLTLVSEMNPKVCDCACQRGWSDLRPDVGGFTEN